MKFLFMLVMVFYILMVAEATIQPRAPNFQYFERPKYRYPYYDENGKGKLLYGYGGSDLFQYKSYSPLEGIHWHETIITIELTYVNSNIVFHVYNKVYT